MRLAGTRPDACATQCAREKASNSVTSQPFVAEDEGRPHTINHCKNCHNLERSEPEVTHARWKATIGGRSSRGSLSACLVAKRVEGRILRAEAATAVQLGKSWPEESPCKEELELLARE